MHAMSICPESSQETKRAEQWTYGHLQAIPTATRIRSHEQKQRAQAHQAEPCQSDHDRVIS
jgi:hypothetical protein